MAGFGKKLQDLRGGKTQYEVAQAIGVVPSAIAMYENEQRMPRDDVKVKLANYYNTTVGYIFYGESSQYAN